MSIWSKIVEKLNPVQHIIADDYGTTSSSTQTKILTIERAYELVEVVNRCINLLVDNSSMVNFDVGSSLPFTGNAVGMKGKTLDKILNYRPNPYMDVNTFRRLVLMDFLIDGNAFIYFDGAGLYHIPAAQMEVVIDNKTYINSFKYNGTESFRADEIIYIKDNSVNSIYRGDSRINSSLESLYTRESMVNFQNAFFKNGASVGLIIETEEILNKKMKDRQEREWMAKFNPTSGAGRPMILDNGQKAKSVSSSDFRSMDYNESIKNLEDKVCVALGVPPILLNSGNNANIKPNLELLFYSTILPMLRKFEAAFEYYFALDIELSTHRVPALKPDQKEQSDRLSALVNNGIMTGNEAREILRMEPIKDPNMEDIRIPQNIAGSGTGVTGQEGGKPPAKEE